MNCRQVIKLFSMDYTRSTGSFVNFICSKSLRRENMLSSSSATLSLPFSQQTHPMHSLRLEGIQGDISTLPTLKESRTILEHAVSETQAGFSQQGIQGNLLSQKSHSNHNRVRNLSTITNAAADYQMEDWACPQGVQGNKEENCGYFSSWLENCQRYGLPNCDQQLQGIQSGRLTLAQVLAEQEALIAEIANSYRRRVQSTHVEEEETESYQGSQGGELRLPEIDTPCPQGVQGDNCVRFELWLQNCHRFGIHECKDQLQGFQAGRLTLAQIFAEQDAIIRQVVDQYNKKQEQNQLSLHRAGQPSLQTGEMEI